MELRGYPLVACRQRTHEEIPPTRTTRTIAFVPPPGPDRATASATRDSRLERPTDDCFVALRIAPARRTCFGVRVAPQGGISRVPAMRGMEARVVNELGGSGCGFSADAERG
jgi:hypothetical protein